MGRIVGYGLLGLWIVTIVLFVFGVLDDDYGMMYPIVAMGVNLFALVAAMVYFSKKVYKK